MNKKLIIFLVLFTIISCKQVKKEEHTSQTKNTIKEVVEKHPNCFTNIDVDKIRRHFELLEKTIKSGKKFDFSNSPISYTEKEKEWLVKMLNNRICKGSLNEFSGSCPKNITYNIDCSEVIIADGEEIFSEQDYWYVLTKKDGRIFVSNSGGAG